MKTVKEIYHLMKNKLGLEEYILIDAKTLETAGKIFVRKKWLTNNRFLFVIFGGWLLAFVFGCIMLYNAFKNNIEMDLLEKAHAEKVQEHIWINDSLQNVIKEQNSFDSLIHRSYDVFTGFAGKISKEKLFAFIESCNPWYPDLIMAQAIQESGCGTSKVAKRCNNLFGMAKPKSRKWRCDKNRTNKKEKYAEYEDWRYSVIDRILWEKWYFRGKSKPSRTEYLNVIQNVYNTECDEYASLIDSISEQYKK